MCSAQVQTLLQPSPVDPFSQPYPIAMKMALDFIAPISKESGPQLPPLNIVTTYYAQREKPTLPSLSQCQLLIPRARRPISSRSNTTLPKPPQLLLPFPKASAISRRLQAEPYLRFRERESSPYRSSSSAASSRASNSPVISPIQSPGFPQSMQFPPIRVHPSPEAGETPSQDINTRRTLSDPSTTVPVDEPTAYPTFPGGHIALHSSNPASSNPRTCERPEYDFEELFAIVSLRLAKPGSVPWKEVKIAFSLLFPPHTPRRTTAPRSAAKNLLPTYSERDVGGLECRYYRIRIRESMGEVRGHRRKSDSITELEKEGLFNMQRELVKGWLKTLDHPTKIKWDLLPKEGENARNLLDKAVKAYEERSSFWDMLTRVRTSAVAGAFASRN